MFLRFDGRLNTGDVVLDTDLRGLDVVSMPGGFFLYSSTGINGGLVGWQLDGAGVMPQEIDRLYFDQGAVSWAGQLLACVTLDGQQQLVVGGTNETLLGYQLSDSGQLPNLPQSGAQMPGAGAITAIAAVAINGSEMIYVVNSGSGTLSAYRLDGAGVHTQDATGGSAPIVGSGHLEVVSLGSESFLLATAAGMPGVVSYRISATTGELEYVDRLGAAEGLGVSTPTAMLLVQAFGSSWVLLGSAQSNSLSVMMLDATGALHPAEHVIDTLNTRFGAVQAIAVAQSADHVFVVAGGGDDGLSLFALLPDGRLVHLQSLAHVTGDGLENVADIEAVIIGDEMRLYVSSSATGGLSQFTVPLAGLGEVIRDTLDGGQAHIGSAGHDLMVAGDSGTDTLRGGAGDDILVAGASDVAMYGGAGADIFVLREGDFVTRIHDFTAGVDRIDMSDFALLRAPGQLEITVTSWGAIIRFRTATIEVTSATGGPLTLAQIFGPQFDWPDRVVVLSTPEDDTPVGGAGSDLLMGSAQDDTLIGGGGNDTLEGAGGNDLLDGGTGADRLVGGTGDDTLAGGLGQDSLHGNGGNDSLGGGDGSDLIFGGDGDDSIMGGAGDDVAWGGAGDDTILGGDGNDTIGGGPQGNDALYGGAGDDEAWAGAGQDLVYGGRGNDTLGGGNGADTLYGEAGHDMIWGGANHDTLYGGEGDDLLGGG